MDPHGSGSEWTEAKVEDLLCTGSGSAQPPLGDESHQMSFGLASVFSYEELKEATNSFDSSQELGCGGYGRVYLGKLRGHKVAIKKLYDDNPRILEQFFNEVTVLSRIRHPNLVTLLGCSNPHSRELLLVYQFVPNGTVADHLHGQQPTLSWGARIRIAIETAEVLSYLHASEPAIIHRDVKSSNILLDNALHVKLADLGICRLMPWDTTNVSTAPQGTVGYRDPEYDMYFKLTDKSDVYSFGVLLLELLSGKEVVDVNRATGEIYLVGVAINKIMNKELEKLIDPELGYHSDCDVRRMADAVAELACMCLQQKGEVRPSMLEVVTLLKGIKDGSQHMHGKDIGLKKVDVGSQAYVFSRKELSKATNSFDPSRELGYGELDKAYRGKLQDGRMVVVKVLDDRNSERLEKIVNRVKVLSPHHHKHLVAVYGYTKPSFFRKKLLVYEHVGNTNHTLTDFLHVQRVTLSWALRIEIAIETAEAVSYLHSLEIPVVYQDLKTSNILLDSAFHVKVSVLPLINEWTVSDGTRGYMDPQFNVSMGPKSDVYSFGVVLLELISGEQPKEFFPVFPEFCMVRNAVNKIINNRLEEFVDPKLEYHSDCEVRRMINSVANLAFVCLQPNHHRRPSMKEVLTILKQIEEGTQHLHGKDTGSEEVVVFGNFTKANIVSRKGLYEPINSCRWAYNNKYVNDVYPGVLNGQKVAVKVLSNNFDHYLEWTEMLFNEVAIVSHLRHKNLVTLYGCTDPRMQEMFFVYEHVPHGTVCDLIHGRRPLVLSWAVRMQIAIETAEALSYLHSLEPPIIQNGVTTNNMLLDEGFHVKLTGLSLFIRWTADAVVGAKGYVEPKYRERKPFKLITIKNDVYSFGVVLLELVSGKVAFNSSLRNEERYLADMALDKNRNNELSQLIDTKLDYQLEGIITSVAQLACRCLLPKENMRPSMVEVLAALKEIGSDCSMDNSEKGT